MTHLSPQQFSAHLDSALVGASLQLVEHHLQMCERCRDELAALTLQDQMLTETLRAESDRELFELIGLRVQSVVHPQRARALEKAIADLESTREERRRQAESVARRVAELREIAPHVDHGATDLSLRPDPIAPSAPPSPTRAGGAEALPSPTADLRRRALDEARARAEAEARAFALESERTRQAAEQRVLDQTASRVRNEAAARRKADEEGRARAAAAARVQAEQLARAAEAALADAENSARDAREARARAEARAAAAQEAGRQARRKAEEARRLEAELAGAEHAADEANAAHTARSHLEPDHDPTGEIAKSAEAVEADEPATLSADEVDAYRDWPGRDDARRARARRPRRMPPRAARAEPRRTSALSLVASAIILLAAFWYAIGRPWLGHDSIGTRDAQAPAASGAAAPGAPQPPAASEAATPATPGPEAPIDESHKARHAPASPLASAPGETGGAEMQGAGDAEPEEEPALDLGLLCGTVRDAQGRAVAGARVIMADLGLVVLTDRVGRFCLTAPRGSRTLTVVATGFAAQHQRVSVGRRAGELRITLGAGDPGSGAGK